MSHLFDHARVTYRHALLRASDLAYAVRHGRPGPEILVLRTRSHLTGFNGSFLRWVAREDPRAAGAFTPLRIPSKRPIPLGGVRLVLPWVQDPIREHHPRVYESLKELEARCDAHGIPVVNRADALSNSIKSVAAGLMNAAGIRTARHVPITDVAAFRRSRGGLSFPLLVREDRGHGNQILLVRDEAELVAVPLESYQCPLAVEFVDTRGADGLYRKYRYVAIGNGGAPRHALISTSWEVRAGCRVVTAATVAEEVAFLLAPTRHRDLFRRAREALGLDVVAFDYAYDAAGSLIVWEANPAAVWWTRENDRPHLRYQTPYVERLYQELLSYYLGLAGIAGRGSAAHRPSTAAVDTRG